ncbi:hypothetical protein SK128_005949, partial [Halocaridina rubra]
ALEALIQDLKAIIARWESCFWHSYCGTPCGALIVFKDHDYIYPFSTTSRLCDSV